MIPDVDTDDTGYRVEAFTPADEAPPGDRDDCTGDGDDA